MGGTATHWRHDVTEIDRLLETSPNRELRALLSAALNDAPPDGSLRRVATGLGVVVAGATWSTAATGALGVGAASGATLASPAGALTALGLGKWLAIGAVAGTVVSGGAVAIDRFVSAPSSPVAAPASAAFETASGAVNAPRLREPIARPVEPVPERPEAPTHAAPPAGDWLPATPSTDSGALAAEVERIDRARRALEAGDARRALAEIAAYERERQLGVLDREATLLAIRAHQALGDTGRARDLAHRYLTVHPNDAHAPRLRALVAEKDR
jgi:hypothetical protein